MLQPCPKDMFAYLEASFSCVKGKLFAQHKKASNHHANLPLEMYSFTL